MSNKVRILVKKVLENARGDQAPRRDWVLWCSDPNPRPLSIEHFPTDEPYHILDALEGKVLVVPTETEYHVLDLRPYSGSEEAAITDAESKSGLYRKALLGRYPLNRFSSGAFVKAVAKAGISIFAGLAEDEFDVVAASQEDLEFGVKEAKEIIAEDWNLGGDDEEEN